ncbi:MAG: alpha/beta fold hydrolase [Thermomicrobiales bacterium]
MERFQDSERVRDGVVRVDGLELHFREWGDPAAERVVLLHGLMGHSREWDLVASSLSDRFDVFVPDQRGHGRSSWSDRYDISRMSSDVEAFAGLLNLTNVALVGHSMGGMIGMTCAANRPDLVSHLIALDITPDSLASEVLRRSLIDWLRFLAGSTYETPQEAVQVWLDGDELAHEPLIRHYVEHALIEDARGRFAWRFDAAGLTQLVESGVSSAQLWEVIERIEVPTLLVRGEFSTVATESMVATTVNRLADARSVEIPGAAHDLGVQQPQRVAEVIGAFLDESKNLALSAGPARSHGHPVLG